MFLFMIILLGISLLVLLVSFFLRDPIKDLRNDLDQMSIQQVQELYKIKKKLKVLEEELMIGDEEFNSIHTPPMNRPFPEGIVTSSVDSVHAIIKHQVWTLAGQGIPLDKIAAQSSLSVSQVQQIIKERDGDGR